MLLRVLGVLSAGGVLLIACGSCNLFTLPTGSACSQSGTYCAGLLIQQVTLNRSNSVSPDFFPTNAEPIGADLSQWLPPARSQGTQGSCVGFALGYALKTFQEAREHGWDVRNERHQFSPAFIYNQIRLGGCGDGAELERGLHLLQSLGCLTLADAPYDPNVCGAAAVSVIRPIRSTRIAGFNQIPRGVVNIKAKLDAGIPVVIGLKVYNQWFTLAQGRATYDTISDGELTNHCLLAVGYDENRQAIRVFNSCGPEWGENGYAWIPCGF